MMRDTCRMRRSGRFGVALALCLALAVASVTAAISMSVDADGLDVAELIRVEPLPDSSTSGVDDHLRWLFEVFGRERQWTDADLTERFTPGFAAGFSADQLNQDLEALFDDLGPIRFVRVADREPGLLRAVAVAENGTPMTVVVATTESDVGPDRIDSLALDEAPSPARLRPWEATLALITAWLLLAVAAVGPRRGPTPELWTALVGSGLAASTVLILSDSATAYTAGRVLPALLAPASVALLASMGPERPRRWIVGLAGLGGAVGALAPFLRDATTIGHPAVLVSSIDDADLYRTALAVASLFVATALTVLALTVGSTARRSARWHRPPLLAAATIAVSWAVVSAMSAVDLAFGAGRMIGGALLAATWSALAAVPALMLVQLLASRLDRPELANLVIDLEDEEVDLEEAVARALDDESLRLLTSPDGRRLENGHGDGFDRDRLSDGRALTEIRSGSQLLGAFVHDAALTREPDRLQAVAAAAGMALDVSRLNRQVTTQLDEVNASRARIVQANDDARRRLERDLHDGAQQRLVALGLELQRSRRRARAGASVEELASDLDTATTEVRDALDEIRAVSRGAQPALLAERGLDAAVEALVDRAPVPVELDLAADALPPAATVTAYYVIAEGLTNVARHARATRAEVSLTASTGLAIVRIDDDGAGGAEAFAGSGLEGLGDRVAASGGSLDISSTPSGTTLTATIPCG